MIQSFLLKVSRFCLGNEEEGIDLLESEIPAVSIRQKIRMLEERFLTAVRPYAIELNRLARQFKRPTPVSFKATPVKLDTFGMGELEQQATDVPAISLSKKKPASAIWLIMRISLLIKRVSPIVALKRLRHAPSGLLVLAHNLFGIACWVNFYTVTRSFGGGEAGGWYYLRYTCEKSRQIGFWEAEALRLRLLQQYSPSHKWGDLQTGGQDVAVCIEKRKAARQTKVAPAYSAIPAAFV
ncbi:hypothetical protein [Cohnella soli]|uniref:Uncharacterized protein n=1 Tax=Cohnella soli TaxID=425005 RepID=A0ABW0HN31_9BACL